MGVVARGVLRVRFVFGRYPGVMEFCVDCGLFWCFKKLRTVLVAWLLQFGCGLGFYLKWLGVGAIGGVLCSIRV